MATTEAMVILKSNCFSCHNPDKEKGGLDLTICKSLLRGGDEEKVISPEKAASSRLIQSQLTGADPHMLPKAQLSPRSISALEAWINNEPQFQGDYCSSITFNACKNTA